jgi:hypothetical protein
MSENVIGIIPKKDLQRFYAECRKHLEESSLRYEQATDPAKKEIFFSEFEGMAFILHMLRLEFDLDPVPFSTVSYVSDEEEL